MGSSTELVRNDKILLVAEKSIPFMISQSGIDNESRRAIANRLEYRSDFDTSPNNLRASTKSNRSNKPDNNAIPNRICTLQLPRAMSNRKYD
jgi:hypothetical protein